MKYILIVGLGNMGKAHYEAILKVKTKKRIYLFDIIESQSKSIKLINNDLNKTEVCKNLDEIVKKIDLLILSTTAEGRYSILIDILSKIKVNKILFEKFLFQKLVEYNKTKKILAKNNIKAWVHLPLRLAPIFNLVKKEITKNNTFILRSLGGDWSMASNIIHSIDLFTFLTNSKSLQILHKNFDQKKLNSKKRKKYDEVSGNIYAKGINNHYLEISKDRLSQRPKEFELISKNSHIIISNNFIYIRDIKRWKFIKNKFQFPSLNQIGDKILGDILINNKSALPKFNDAIISHQVVFSLFKNILKNNKLNIT